MARRAITDPLQNHKFWLFDASVVESLQLPVFSPLLGFSRITMPEITLEQEDIIEGNWLFPRKVIKRASISSITLERASTFQNSDFWRWMVVALTGDTSGNRFFAGNKFLQQVTGGVSPRKTLVLIQFFARFGGRNRDVANQAGDRFVSTLGDRSADRRENRQDQRATSAAKIGIGPVDLVPLIPAKAWILHGCLPTRMKPGSDFDATSADISMQELEISLESVEEISLADPL